MLELNPINSVVCNSHVYQMVSVIDSKLCYNATLVTLFFLLQMHIQQQEIQKTRDKRAGRAHGKKILYSPLHLK